MRDAANIESILTAFAREQNGGIIVTPSPVTNTKDNREVYCGVGRPPASADDLPVPFICRQWRIDFLYIRWSCTVAGSSLLRGPNSAWGKTC